MINDLIVLARQNLAEIQDGAIRADLLARCVRVSWMPGERSEIYLAHNGLVATQGEKESVKLPRLRLVSAAEKRTEESQGEFDEQQ